MTEIKSYKMKELVLYFEQVYMQMQISMIKVNVVMACKILVSQCCCACKPDFPKTIMQPD